MSLLILIILTKKIWKKNTNFEHYELIVVQWHTVQPLNMYLAS